MEEQLPVTPDVDWILLRTRAVAVMRGAYAPYSGFSVGAAAITSDGRYVTGCNVENVSYGLTLCAECTLIGNLYISGAGRLRALSCVNAEGDPILPCGRCRQLLHEHAGPDLLIDHRPGPIPLGRLLPNAFGPDDLAAIG